MEDLGPQNWFFAFGRKNCKIKRVLLENYIVDDIKAYVGVMEECRLRQKAFMDAVMELKWAQVRATNQHERQVMALEIARVKAKRTQMMDPFRVTVELEEFGFGFWKLFWAKTAFSFKWPQKGHKWICEFIIHIVLKLQLFCKRRIPWISVGFVFHDKLSNCPTVP